MIPSNSSGMKAVGGEVLYIGDRVRIEIETFCKPVIGFCTVEFEGSGYKYKCEKTGKLTHMDTLSYNCKVFLESRYRGADQ